MKIEIFDTKEFVELNELEEVTSPIIFQRGGIPDPDGLVSTRIFGVNVKDRKHRFAYIDLGGYYFHPHVYKAFKRVFRNIERIVNGSEYYSIDENGALIKDDENGETGIEFIYKNWEKIRWDRTVDESAMRKERLDLLMKSKKHEVFTRYQIVIPVFYRDINTSSSSTETDPLNSLYSKQIRLVSMIKNKDMFDFTFNSTNYSIQSIMVEIYDIFKHKLERKNGMIRKYLMGKNVDNCVRTVISAPLYHYNTPEDTPTRFGETGIPLGQICSLMYPFMQAWVKNFFEREFILNQEMKSVMILSDDKKEFTTYKLYKPELYFNEKYIKKMIDRYISDPESRFNLIEVPIDKDKTAPVAFTGKHMDPSGTHELSTIAQRPMTVTDLLFIAAMDVVKGKHALITRYPVSDAYGIFIAHCTPITTIQTEVVKVNDTIYTHYPKVDLSIKPTQIPIRFIDSMQFSNSYLDGLGGDYDGDQVTVKILWTLEANEECERVMNAKSFFISPSGSNVRKIKYECLQTMYDLTKDPDGDSKLVLSDAVKKLIEKPAKEYTFDFLVELFAYRRNGKDVMPRKYAPNDIVVLEPNQYHNKERVKTTIGRLVWNKIMVERVGVWNHFQYFNKVMTKKNYMSYEAAMTLLLREDQIDTGIFRTYLDHRDWLGLQLHAVITASFTEKTVKTPENVKKLREELFKKYEKELANGDVLVANKIEQELIQAMVNEIKDDPGFDLYASGARGDIANHMKNLFLMRGGVMNPNTGKYEIMKTSFNDGLRKEDFTAASNSVVQGAYPKAVGTADSGYLAKQLMAGMQTEVLADEGTDCGTETTLDFVFEESDINDFQQRYINDNGHTVLLTSKNSKNYVGNKIRLYSPMCCKGVQGGKICAKCGGKQDSKFIGLDSNKIATTLTNLNMKKFHDSTLRFSKINPRDAIINFDGTELFTDDGEYLVAKEVFEIYVPMDFYDAGLVEDLGNMINLFGLVPVGVFKNGAKVGFDTLNIPSWNKYNVFTAENRMVDIPGLGETPCKVLHYLPGHQICASNMIQDSINAQMFLKQITYGKVPTTIPYNQALNVWRKNQKLNNVNFGVPSVIQEVVLSCCYRYKKDPSKKFATVYGRNPSIDQYGYEMAGIRRICQVTSTFTGITFESFDDMVTTSVNRARENGHETDSPLEMLFKL